MEKELDIGEDFFINVVRSFDFLRQYNYNGNEFSLIGREIWVSYFNPRSHIKMTVIMEEPFVLNVYFEKRFFLNLKKFSLRDYYEKLGVKYLEKTNDVKTIATFIRENLMPVIRGEKWIDEFLKQKNEAQ